MHPPPDQIEKLKREWTDAFVEIATERPDLKRFAGMVGRVVTVNWNGKALVDFQDGAWYDISLEDLRRLEAEEARQRYDASANSAQQHPARKS